MWRVTLNYLQPRSILVVEPCHPKRWQKKRRQILVSPPRQVAARNHKTVVCTLSKADQPFRRTKLRRHRYTRFIQNWCSTGAKRTPSAQVEKIFIRFFPNLYLWSNSFRQDTRTGKGGTSLINRWVPASCSSPNMGRKSAPMASDASTVSKGRPHQEQLCNEYFLTNNSLQLLWPLKYSCISTT